MLAQPDYRAALYRQWRRQDVRAGKPRACSSATTVAPQTSWLNYYNKTLHKILKGEVKISSVH